MQKNGWWFDVRVPGEIRTEEETGSPRHALSIWQKKLAPLRRLLRSRKRQEKSKKPKLFFFSKSFEAWMEREKQASWQPCMC